MSKATQAVNLVAANPNITAKELAKKLKTKMPYAYKLLSEAKRRYSESPAGGMLGKPKTPMQASKPRESWQLAYVTTSGQSILEGGPTEAELNGTDNVNHPAHYKTGGIETIDFIEAKNLNYHLGNVVKYITRADHKGDRLENLKKAQWYLNREIQKGEGK